MSDPSGDGDGKRGDGRLSRSSFMRGIGITAGAVVLGGTSALNGIAVPLKALAATKPIKTTSAKVGVLLGNVKNLKAGQALSYTDPKSGDPAVLIRLATGQFVSYDAVCTHAGCTVPYDPARKLLVCPCHGATYDPARGARVIAGPAPQPLAPLPIRVDAAGNVYALDAKPQPGKASSGLHQGPPPSKGGDDGAGGNDDGKTTRNSRGRHAPKKHGDD